jgi:putative ABC transport system permease protein
MLWVPRITASSQGHDAQFAIRNFGGSPGFPDRFALIMRQGATPTTLAVGVGLLLSLAAGRVLSQILYQVSPSDPFALICSSLLLSVAALLACFLPARRAMRVNPITALRME